MKFNTEKDNHLNFNSPKLIEKNNHFTVPDKDDQFDAGVKRKTSN